MKHYPYQRNTACRLLVDQSWCGYHAVTLQNRHLRVTVLPEKGGDIIELLHKPSDTDVLFLSPNGLRRDDHADFTLNDGPGAFMDRYPGAWQEILPAGGPPASHGGIGFGQHGEISVLPWRCEVVADTPDEVAIALTVQTVRTPLRLRRVMRLRRDEAVLHLEETLTNLSPQRMPVMWGHHPAFGGGFLETGCVLEVAAATIEVPQETAFATQRLAPGTRGPWPELTGFTGAPVNLAIMPPRDANSADYFYLTDLREGRYRILNPRLQLAVEMRWDLAVMPHLWFWQVAGGAPDYPWWSQTYSMALEPFTSKVCNYAEAVAADDVLWLAPRSAQTFELSVGVHPLP
jgi:galactose mutarotase-like enzyme